MSPFDCLGDLKHLSENLCVKLTIDCLGNLAPRHSQFVHSHCKTHCHTVCLAIGINFVCPKQHITCHKLGFRCTNQHAMCGFSSCVWSQNTTEILQSIYSFQGAYVKVTHLWYSCWCYFFALDCHCHTLRQSLKQLFV